MGPLRSFGPASIIDAFDASYAYGYAYSHPRLGAAGGPASGRVIEQAELAVEDLAAVLLIGCQLQRGPTIVLVDLETGSVSDEVTGSALGSRSQDFPNPSPLILPSDLRFAPVLDDLDHFRHTQGASVASLRPN